MESSLKAKIIICDIEGTTSSISFVKNTLFSYARKHVKNFLKTYWNDEQVKLVLKDLETLSKRDVEDKIQGSIEIIDGDVDSAEKIDSIVKNVEFLMNNDRKVSALKSLQGLIWEQGYKDGSIKGHVFEDVPKSFELWTSTGHKVFIYSSGSIAAQKLLFEFSSAGNLLKYLSGHFDTAVGPKQEKQSYAKILEELVDVVPADVVFLTDIIEEATAAKQAGLHTIVLNRPGNKSFSDEDKKEFSIVESFDDIIFEPVMGNKRKIDEETNEQEPPLKLVKTDPKIEGKSDKIIETTDEKTEIIEIKTKNGNETEENTVSTAVTTEELIITDINEGMVAAEKINEIKLISNKTENEGNKDCPLTEAEKMETDSLEEKTIRVAKVLDEIMEVDEEKERETEIKGINNIKSDIKSSGTNDENIEVNGDKILCETELKNSECEKDTISTEDVTIDNVLKEETGDIEKQVTDLQTDEIIETKKTEIVEPTVTSEKNETDLNKTENVEETTNESKITEMSDKEQNITENKENNINNVTTVNEIKCTKNVEESVKEVKEEEKSIKNEEPIFPLGKQEEKTVETTEIKIATDNSSDEKSLLAETSALTETTKESIITEKAEEQSEKHEEKVLPVEKIIEISENLEKVDDVSIKIKTDIEVGDKNGADDSSKKNGDSDKEDNLSKKNCDSDKENDIENKTESTKIIEGKESVSSEILLKKVIDDVIMTKVQAET